MKKINLKIILISIFLSFFCITFSAQAAKVELVPEKDSVGLGGQFYIDVLLNPEEISLNAIEGTISYPTGEVALMRIEEGKSMIGFWIKKPVVEGDKVSFAGIMPNGFSGVIDPFSPKNKLPGHLLRLVFQSKFAGPVIFKTESFVVAENDGQGTTENIPDTELPLQIDQEKSSEIYPAGQGDNPELEAYVVKDLNLYNNKYVLVFEARDDGAGIKEVKIKEGGRDWKSIKSPYLLEDQSRSSLISLQAINFSGASIIITINPIPHEFFSISSPILYLLIILIIVFITKKIYEKKSKKNNI